ncbi:MAG: DNA methyltransferase [Actinomycetota bacterium]
MSTADFHIGDSRAVMRRWATNGGIPTPWGPQQAHLILTSPPFLALRSYLPDDDPAKDLEMGSEPTPAAFLDALLDWTAACADLLSPEGSLAVELGDTYSGSGGAGGDYAEGGMREAQAQWSGSARKRIEAGITDGGRPARSGRNEGWPLAKCKTLIPELYRIALAYGINPLTGAESPAGRWRVRNVVTWARPNPPVGSLGDKYRPATSDLVVACRDEKRWFDLDAVRQPPSPKTNSRTAKGVERRKTTGKRAEQHDGNFDTLDTIGEITSAPPLDWWEISTEPYKGSHYATWPRELCRRPILSMCPTEVSIATGEGRRRIVGEPTYMNRRGDVVATRYQSGGKPGGSLTEARMKTGNSTRPIGSDSSRTAITETLGWTDTDADGQYRPGIVLDPFAGSGTTLAVATGHGRYAVGIDLDRRNADLAAERVGPLLLTVHDDREEAA